MNCTLTRKKETMYLFECQEVWGVFPWSPEVLIICFRILTRGLQQPLEIVLFGYLRLECFLSGERILNLSSYLSWEIPIVPEWKRNESGRFQGLLAQRSLADWILNIPQNLHWAWGSYPSCLNLFWPLWCESHDAGVPDIKNMDRIIFSLSHWSFEPVEK